MSGNLSEVLLVGAGYMAREYAKVLTGLNYSFQVVGRGEESAKKFEIETGHAVLRGGIDNYLQRMGMNLPPYCIVAVRVEQIADVCCALLRYGAKKILLEKPGSFSLEEMMMMSDLAKEKQAEVSIAYNRRFYASTRAARKIIEEDGGVVSFQFEFTEWIHRLLGFKKNSTWVHKIFIGNSSHVLDLAFFLGGRPKEINCYSKPSIDNYDCCMAFAGAGRTEKDALFSYNANWEAPGRWGVEVLTAKHRLIFRPLEKLQIQKMKSVIVEEAVVDYTLDELYKPGLCLEVKAFLKRDDNFRDLCSLDEQIENVKLYGKFIVTVQ